MKLTKTVLLIVLMATNVASIDGMKVAAKLQKLAVKLRDKTLSEQDILKILQKAIDEDCPSLINSLVEKNVNLSGKNAQDLLKDAIIGKKLPRYDIGSAQER